MAAASKYAPGFGDYEAFPVTSSNDPRVLDMDDETDEETRRDSLEFTASTYRDWISEAIDNGAELSQEELRAAANDMAMPADRALTLVFTAPNPEHVMRAVHALRRQVQPYLSAEATRLEEIDRKAREKRFSGEAPTHWGAL